MLRRKNRENSFFATSNCFSNQALNSSFRSHSFFHSSSSSSTFPLFASIFLQFDRKDLDFSLTLSRYSYIRSSNKKKPSYDALNHWLKASFGNQASCTIADK